MNWLDNTDAATVVAPNAVAAPKKKRTLLPLLTALFVVSYGLMTLLIVEQGATIQSQSNLIHVLMPESRELWGLRGKAIADKQAAKTQAQAATQTPKAQNAPAQAPSSNAKAQSPAVSGSPNHAQSHVDKATKAPIQFPPIPASDLDPRRTVRTI
jgi:DNA replication initiation complex subunit (GINS family)